MLKDSKIKSYISIKQFDHDYNNQVSRIIRERLMMDSETSIISSKGAILGKLCESNPFNLLQINCISGYFENVCVHLEFEINDWQPENYICIPAAVYNGNRFESRKIPYSPKLVDEQDIGPDKPLIISDIPRLSVKQGFSRIQLKSGAMTLPCLGIFFKKLKQQFWIITKPQQQGFETGLFIEENRDKTRLRISLAVPAVRELFRYTITDCSSPVFDEGISLKTGDTIELPFKIYEKEAHGLSDFFSGYFNIRQQLSHGDIKPLFSYSSCFATIEEKYNHANWVEEPGYYSVGMRDGKYPFLQDWQLGWTGGMIATLPLFVEGKDQSKERCWKHFRWFFAAPLSPAGLFWDAGEKGNIWYGGDIRRKHTADWHLTRKSADGIYYLMKQFILFQMDGNEVPKEWLNKTTHVIEKLLDIFKEYGQLGQFIHSQTGEVVVGGSTSAALLPAGLVLASDFYKNKKYAEAGVDIAKQLFKEFESYGLTCGGPGDALQAADSESAYGLFESLVTVYEYTKDKQWLERAQMAAQYFSTWVMSYNYLFPNDSALGQLKTSTRGSVFANAQNTHSAPGICTYSGVALIKLFRNTEDIRYLHLLKEITSNIPQYVSHPLRPIPGMKEGYVSERINTTDWLEGIGELMYGSTWSEVALMLTYTEIPGVYIVPDMNLAIAFDHIECTFHENDDQFIVEIINPTKSVSKIYVFNERKSGFKTNFEASFSENKQQTILQPYGKASLSYKK
jgi:hypothetical protein